MEFAPNSYLVDKVIEKKFWYRHSREGWSGLVSEPVDVRWHENKDLSEGLLNAVWKAWTEEQLHLANTGSRDIRALLPEQEVLRQMIGRTALEGITFFAWFGFIGRRISHDENVKVLANLKAKKAARAAGRAVSDFEQPPEGEQEAIIADKMVEALEIFPNGDDLAVSFAEDLWPGAIKYFSMSSSISLPIRNMKLTKTAQAQENDALSDDSFEESDDGKGSESPEREDGD